MHDIQIVDGVADSEPQLRCHRISAHGFRSAIVLDKPECPHCHRHFSSISSARHHARHQSCQRRKACTTRAVRHEVVHTKIASSPTELASTPVNHVVLHFNGKTEDPVKIGLQWRAPMTSRLRNLEGIAWRRDYDIRSLAAWSSHGRVFNPAAELAPQLLNAPQNYNKNNRRTLSHTLAKWLVPRLPQQSQFNAFHEMLTKPAEIEALSIQVFVAPLPRNRTSTSSVAWNEAIAALDDLARSQ